MNRRLFSLLLAAMMALGLLSGATAAAESPQTISYWANLEFSNVLTSRGDIVPYQVAEERLGIDVEWLHPPTGQTDEQFNLMIVSPDLPDIIDYTWGKYPGGAEAAIENNIIIELNDLIDQYMPNYKAYLEKFPEVETMVKTDTGKHYCIPYIYTATPAGSPEHQGIDGRVPAYETYMGLFIRQDLLDAAGLDVPVTLDDWYEALKAFQEQGIAAPLSGMNSHLLESQAFISAFDIAHGLYEKEGQVHFGPAEEGYLDYLTFMNKLYDEGLLDADFAIIDDTTMKSKILTQSVGAWPGYTSTYMGVQYDQIHTEDPDSLFYPVGVTNPKAAEDQTLLYRQASYPYRNAGAAISSSCENIEAALTFLDYFWSEEGDMLINWGVEGESYVIENGYPTFTDLIRNDPDGYSPTDAFARWRVQNGPFCMDHNTRLMSKGAYMTPESINALYTWEENSGLYPATLPPVTLLPEESSEYANKFTEIDTYVAEMRTKFIMGATPLSEFDSFVEQLQRMGVEDVISIQQNALDRYYAR